MGYNTDNTVWPTTGMSEATKGLLDRFFNTLDNTSPDAGDTLADEIFSPDAKAQFGAHTFSGQEGDSPQSTSTTREPDLTMNRDPSKSRPRLGVVQESTAYTATCVHKER